MLVDLHKFGFQCLKALQSANHFLSGIEKKFHFQRFKAHVPLGNAKVKHMLLHEFLVWTNFSLPVFRNASLFEFSRRKKDKKTWIFATLVSEKIVIWAEQETL